MSAIIAGVSCAKCENKYYISLGHPAWFDTWMKRKKITPQLKRFWKISESELCPACLMGIVEFNELVVEIMRRIEYGRKIKRKKRRKIKRRKNNDY